jgi:adenylate cyclase class 2
MSEPTREVELKARVDDLDAARRNIENAGATLVFEGRLCDRLYDTPSRSLTAADFVLRLRSYSGRETPDGGARTVSAHLDWKGPTLHEGGFKVRAELTTSVGDPDALSSMLARLGYEVAREIDRDIAQYEMADHESGSVLIIRFERYPRMDTLVEVEGTPAAIERGIRALGIPRDRFSSGRLTDFARAYEARTGNRAAVCDRDLRPE